MCLDPILGTRGIALVGGGRDSLPAMIDELLHLSTVRNIVWWTGHGPSTFKPLLV